MKAAIVEKPDKIKVRDIPIPKIDDNYGMLLKMKACALCNGTDLKIINGHFPYVKDYPAVLGHEGVGEIVEIGKKVRTHKIGEIILEPNILERDDIKLAYGGFAEYTSTYDFVAMYEDGARKSPHTSKLVPKDINPVEATILLTLEETLSGLINFGLKKDMGVVIFGDGPVGCALAKFAKILGANMVIGVGHWEERLQKMKDMGADYVVNETNNKSGEILNGKKFDLVIDAVGRKAIMDKGMELIKQGGKLGVYGVVTDSEVTFKMNKWPNNASVQMLYFPSGHNKTHDRIIEYVRTKEINLKDFYSHIIKLDEIEKGVELVKNRKAFKVIAEM
jgi:2-desacetyl-2-hydroxyethyl bacteriochlorophyllide A dehydrogenase